MIIPQAETKERILMTALDLFSKFGFRSISMDDIAHHVGMSKKTLYQYFADKDEIVTLTIENRLQQECKVVTKIQEETKNAVDFIIRINNYLTRNIRDTRSATIYDLKKYHANAWVVVEKFRNEFLLTTVIDNLRTGIAEGNYRSDINVDILSRLRLEEISALINNDFFPDKTFNLADVSSAILDHFIAGIATEKGMKLYRKYSNQENATATIL